MDPQADLNDPIEYKAGRRRPFWDVIRDRALLGDTRAADILGHRRATPSQEERDDR